MAEIKSVDDAIKALGLKKGFVSEKMGVSRPYFIKKCKHPESFTVSEMIFLCDELSLDSQSRKNIFHI